MKQNETPVQLSVIKTIYDALCPIFYRLYSLMKDDFDGSYTLCEYDRATLLDHLASATALKVLFEEYIRQANEYNTETLYLPKQEFTNIIAMSKLVETSNRTIFGQTGIWSN